MGGGVLCDRVVLFRPLQFGEKQDAKNTYQERQSDPSAGSILRGSGLLGRPADRLRLGGVGVGPEASSCVFMRDRATPRSDSSVAIAGI